MRIVIPIYTAQRQCRIKHIDKDVVLLYTRSKLLKMESTAAFFSVIFTGPSIVAETKEKASAIPGK